MNLNKELELRGRKQQQQQVTIAGLQSQDWRK